MQAGVSGTKVSSASSRPTKPGKMEDATFGELKGDRQPSQRFRDSVQIECWPTAELKDSEPDSGGKLAGGASQRCDVRHDEGAGCQLSQRLSRRRKPNARSLAMPKLITSGESR